MTVLVEHSGRPGLLSVVDRGWRGHLAALGVTLLLALGYFSRDIADMARMWWGVSTYGHCLFILPIIGWLIAERRAEVRQFSPKIWWPGLFVIFAAALVWTMGAAGGIALFRHISIVLMVQAVVLTILGPQVVRAILFPLFYLIFLVPVGEELVPYLQTLTAKLTVILLAVAQVPAEINGVFIKIPNGYFEVAEECSGVKFLIAMVAYGALVSNVCFRSWRRRAAFMAVSIIVPVVANGVRAFGTIYIAWLVDRNFAKGFDHVVYGWFFFAIVLAVVMTIGWRFFDRKVNDPWLSDLKPSVSGGSGNPLMIAVMALATLLTPIAWQKSVAANGRVTMPNQIDLPQVAGWTRVPVKHRYLWAPHFDGADHRLFGTYANANGETVDLAVAVFAWQDEGRELVGYGQGAIDLKSGWAWAANAAKPETGQAERIVAPGPINREVVTVYWVDGKLMGKGAEVKIATAKTRLMGGDQAAVAILVSAEDPPGKSSRPAIDSFVESLGRMDILAENLSATARGR